MLIRHMQLLILMHCIIAHHSDEYYKHIINVSKETPTATLQFGQKLANLENPNQFLLLFFLETMYSLLRLVFVAFNYIHKLIFFSTVDEM